jgi:hypothetical protein
MEQGFHGSPSGIKGGTGVVDLPPRYIFWSENVAYLPVYHPRWRGVLGIGVVNGAYNPDLPPALEML